MANTKDNNSESAFGAVFKQTAIIALISAAVTAAAHPLLILIGSKTELYDYEALRFILGSVYGWFLGVGNFAAMAITLVLLTSSATEKREGQKRAQAAYMGRLVVLLLFAVGGCFIPVFHPAAVLISLALTQFGIFLYSLTFKLVEANKRAKTEKNPRPAGEDAGEGAGENPGEGPDKEAGNDAGNDAGEDRVEPSASVPSDEESSTEEDEEDKRGQA